jgi:DNA-directed RNA polymerase specialized sigma24 family protein
MNKENNCSCVVCKVEHELLDSLSTQTARNHFLALARNYPVLSHFQSPIDVLVRLHDHSEAANHHNWNAILHAVVSMIADTASEEIGQQLLLVAFTPAIHKTFWEVCLRFPSLASEDIAQQAALSFMESAKNPVMQHQNGYLPIALVRDFRKSLFRWAIKEARCSFPVQEIAADHPEPQPPSFEYAVVLEDFLRQSQRAGVLSRPEEELLLKLKYEGFEAKELADAGVICVAPTHRRLHRRLQTILNRLQRVARSLELLKSTAKERTIQTNSAQPKKFSAEAVNFSGDMSISKSDKGFLPELPRQVAPDFETDVVPVAA